MRCFGLALLLSTGCSLFGGLRVESLGTSAQRPSNVAAYVAVTDGDEPISDLIADDFTVYENEQALPKSQTQQVLLDKELVSQHRTVLLVDLSTAAAAERREQLAAAVAGFLEKVRPTQAVTVYSFAGGNNLRLLGEYARSSAPGASDSPSLGDAAPEDASRNLNGAVKQALKELDIRLAQTRKPIRVGTLVVFAAGPDVAGRVSGNDLDTALEQSKHLVIAVGVGPEPSSELSAIGRDGFVTAQSIDTLPIAFEEAAYKVRAQYEKYYLLAYCSPARAGSRRLRLEARMIDKQGDEKKGSMEADFDARGFGAGCNPKSVPHFVAQPATRTDTTAPEKAPESAPRTDAREEPAPAEESDDGGVVPPPDRPGYAK